MNKFFKMLNTLLGTIYIFIIILNLNNLKTIFILFLILIAPLILKLFKVKIPNNYISMYYTIILLSYVGGEIYRFYYLYWWYDNVVHFTSGVFDSFLALSILNTFKASNWFKYSFPIIFTSFLSVLWEIYEYVDDLIFHRDPQWVQSTGVNDTMQDMMIAMLASIVFIIIKLIYDKYVKKINN